MMTLDQRLILRSILVDGDPLDLRFDQIQLRCNADCWFCEFVMWITLRSNYRLRLLLLAH